MPLAVTALYLGLNTLLVVLLIIRVVISRNVAQVAIGTGGDRELERRIRAHGNAVETIPLGLAVIGLCEVAGTPSLALHGMGLALTLGRVLHALHISGALPPLGWRIAGMILTLMVLVGGALRLLAYGLAGL